MCGTKAGGLKCAATNKLIHGDDFYKRIGAIGGKAQNPKKGFGSSHERAVAAGHKGRTQRDLNNEDCEDYKPSEPLIKDEKIRKAVRAWAEANIIKNVMFEYVEGEGSYFSNCSCTIRFYEDLQLTNRHEYTLTELCGKGEE